MPFFLAGTFVLKVLHDAEKDEGSDTRSNGMPRKLSAESSSGRATMPMEGQMLVTQDCPIHTIIPILYQHKNKNSYFTAKIIVHEIPDSLCTVRSVVYWRR